MGLLGTACQVTPAPQPSPDARENAETLAGCTVREVSRKPLVVEDGRLLYVDPGAFVANSRGDVLLAGMYNILTSRNPDGKVTAVTEDSIFGVIIPRTGPARIVPSPIDPKLVSGVRALPHRGGGWDVVFAEVKPYTPVSGRSDTGAARLWHGVYDGRRWTQLEPLPLPPESTIRPKFASRLLQRGDTLFWAMTVITPTDDHHIALFERRGGRWSYEAVPDFHARVELAHSDTLGLILAVTGGSIDPPAGFNSLILWARRPTWRPLRLVVEGKAEGPVHVPWLHLSPTGGVLSWHTDVSDGSGKYRQEARAMIGRLEERNESVITLDSSVASTQNFFAPVLLPGGLRLWVIDHEFSKGQQSEIRFVSDSAQSAVVLGRTPNPYVTSIAATAPAPSELLVTGLHYIPNKYIESLLLRARVECRGKAP
jgi:hypothetical protein